MVKQVLTGAGFEENKTFKETRFLKAPTETYAVFNRSCSRRGADNRNLITDWSNTIELYAYAPDPDAESRIEKSFDDLGLEYEKEERYWIQSEQLYQTIYTFNNIDK